MKDFFALLKQQRQPWLDTESVREAFVRAAAQLHPDRVHEASEQARSQAHAEYTALNEAHLCLKDTRCRLRHFLELERGGRVNDLQEVPEELVQLFVKLNSQLKAADDHCRKSDRSDSPLLRVALFQSSEALQEDLRHTQRDLRQRMDHVDHRVRTLSSRWEHARRNAREREQLLRELESLYRLFSFYDRWGSQVQARLIQMMEWI